MSTATVRNIDRTTLSEEARNALLILSTLPVEDVNVLKGLMHLSTPGVIGPQTVAAFAKLCAGPPVSLDLSNAGVNAFKQANGLGNTGPVAGVIGPQTAGAYYTKIVAALQGAAAGGGRRTINAAGLSLIKNSEGYAQLVPGTTNVTTYLDAVGVPTIGYGHTGPDVTPNLVITQAQAQALLQSDLRGAENAVIAAVTVALNDDQFAALVSFVYNLGAGTLNTSTLLGLLNAGDYNGAAQQFTRFVYAGGEVLQGLVTRRNAERALFLA
jgi:GH24 family phage-related lysozyme (muramidase)